MEITLILIIGLLLRLISVNQSLWLDEGTTALVAKMSLPEIFTKFLPGDFHPPLYYLLVKFWTDVFGYSEFSLRFPSVLFGISTVYLIYIIGKKVNIKLGLIASSFAATSGLLIYYSQEARMYSLVVFCVILAFYAFIEKKWLLFSVILMMVGLTDYVALFILPVFFIYNPKNWKKLVSVLIPLLLTYLIWLPIFKKQLIGGVGIETSSPLWWRILGLTSIKNLLLIPVKFMIGRIGFENKAIYAVFSLVLGLLYSTGIFLGINRNIKPVKLFWLWLTLPLLIASIIAFKIPVLSYFRLIFLLPAMYLLLAKGTLTLKTRYTAIFVGLILIINLSTSLIYLCSPKYKREDWRNLVSFVEAGKDRNSITIFAADSNMEAYRYYAPNAKIAGPGGIKTGYSRVWVMRYLSDIFDPGDNIIKKMDVLGYKKYGEYQFNGIAVWEYKNK